MTKVVKFDAQRKP